MAVKTNYYTLRSCVTKQVLAHALTSVEVEEYMERWGLTRVIAERENDPKGTTFKLIRGVRWYKRK